MNNSRIQNRLEASNNTSATAVTVRMQKEIIIKAGYKYYSMNDTRIQNQLEASNNASATACQSVTMRMQKEVILFLN